MQTSKLDVRSVERLFHRCPQISRAVRGALPGSRYHCWGDGFQDSKPFLHIYILKTVCNFKVLWIFVKVCVCFYNRVVTPIRKLPGIGVLVCACCKALWALAKHTHTHTKCVRASRRLKEAMAFTQQFANDFSTSGFDLCSFGVCGQSLGSRGCFLCAQKIIPTVAVGK